MRNLTYMRMLSPDDTAIPKFKSIYQEPEISRYLAIGESYFRYVTGTENVYFYKIYRNNELVGAIHLETQEKILYLSILVFPEFQRMGLGTGIIQDIQNDIFALGYERIEISVDERNSASLRLFENAGFVFVSKDDRLLNFIYQPGKD